MITHRRYHFQPALLAVPVSKLQSCLRLHLAAHGEVAERSKAHAWKVCIRQKRIAGSNPALSATTPNEIVELGSSGHWVVTTFSSIH